MISFLAEEWFRSDRWDAGAHDDFDTRLNRARAASRPQYLRIKALALMEKNPEAADELLVRLITEYPAHMDAKFGHELRGNLHRQQGRLAEAADAYRSCLERSAGNMSGTSGMLHVSLAEVLLESKNPPTEEILRLLDASMQLNRGSWLNANLFRWERALALVSARIGDRDTSRKAAARALALIEQPPQFARHKDVGIAHATEEERLVLRSLAETGELTTTTRRGRFGRRAR